jgi:hypothetical protein
LPPEKLPLFSEYAYDWSGKDQFVDFVARVSSIRKEYLALVTDLTPNNFVLLTVQRTYTRFSRTTSGSDCQ